MSVFYNRLQRIKLALQSARATSTLPALRPLLPVSSLTVFPTFYSMNPSKSISSMNSSKQLLSTKPLLSTNPLLSSNSSKPLLSFRANGFSTKVDKSNTPIDPAPATIDNPPYKGIFSRNCFFTPTGLGPILTNIRFKLAGSVPQTTYHPKSQMSVEKLYNKIPIRNLYIGVTEIIHPMEDSNIPFKFSVFNSANLNPHISADEDHLVLYMLADNKLYYFTIKNLGHDVVQHLNAEFVLRMIQKTHLHQEFRIHPYYLDDYFYKYLDQNILALIGRSFSMYNVLVGKPGELRMKFFKEYPEMVPRFNAAYEIYNPTAEELLANIDKGMPFEEAGRRFLDKPIAPFFNETLGKDKDRILNKR